MPLNFYLDSGHSYNQVANELGIPPATLVSWVESHKKEGQAAFVGKGHSKAGDAEVMQLRKELTRVRGEQDILKKALSILSSQR